MHRTMRGHDNVLYRCGSLLAALDPAQLAGEGATPSSASHILIQLTPAGRFAPNDGRAGVPAAWCGKRGRASLPKRS